MKKIIIVFLGILLFNACTDSKDTKVIYTDGPPPIDSSAAFMITYDENGEVKDYYINKNFFNKENIVTSKSTLNSNLFYEIKKDSLGKKSKIRAFKYSYMKDSYSIHIGNDTIALGEKFIGVINLSKKNIGLEIEDSASYESEVNKNGSGRTVTFFKRTNALGIGNFKGRLMKHDGIVIPFEYNYVVVKP